jgi:UPF0755 protein
MKKRVRFFVILFIIATISLLTWMLYYAYTPLKINPSAQEIDIKPNSGLKSIANQLSAQNVIKDEISFILLTKIIGKESSLQAGHYTLNRNITPYQLILSLQNGKTTQGGVTFIEGKTFKQMRQKLESNDAIKQTLNTLSDKELIDKLQIPYNHLEGLFFPDTYYFDRNTQDIIILKRAYKSMASKLDQEWGRRANNLPYKDKYQALIMASIIEKETGKDTERKMISGVFNNRLKLGMRLQTDPTVIYGMGERYQGNIRKKDLLTDTEYNTYTRSGLPPTPIAMPGLASIQAALHPANTNALYFVGKGDGSHAFSSNLADHNRAVVKFQLKK